MYYKYLRDTDGSITWCKANCSDRDDIMKQFIHYSPNKTSSSPTDKSIIRLIFTIIVAKKKKKKRSSLQFDTTLVYTSEMHVNSKCMCSSIALVG